MLSCTMGISETVIYTGPVKLPKSWIILVANTCRLQTNSAFYTYLDILQILKFSDFSFRQTFFVFLVKILKFRTYRLGTSFASSELNNEN